jgi:hypothetical protein
VKHFFLRQSSPNPGIHLGHIAALDPAVCLIRAWICRSATNRLSPDSGLFGGNSNWRGPVWFPVNFLIIESLQKFHHYYGDDFLVEFPTGSGHLVTIEAVANELARRLTALFLANENGRRPVFGLHPRVQGDPHFRNTSCSTNTFTATPAAAWAHPIRQVGPASSRNSRCPATRTGPRRSSKSARRPSTSKTQSPACSLVAKR